MFTPPTWSNTYQEQVLISPDMSQITPTALRLTPPDFLEEMTICEDGGTIMCG